VDGVALDLLNHKFYLDAETNANPVQFDPAFHRIRLYLPLLPGRATTTSSSIIGWFIHPLDHVSSTNLRFCMKPSLNRCEEYLVQATAFMWVIPESYFSLFFDGYAYFILVRSAIKNPLRWVLLPISWVVGEMTSAILRQSLDRGILPMRL
jgi:hypothetical protein